MLIFYEHSISPHKSEHFILEIHVMSYLVPRREGRWPSRSGHPSNPTLQHNPCSRLNVREQRFSETRCPLR